MKRGCAICVYAANSGHFLVPCLGSDWMCLYTPKLSNMVVLNRENDDKPIKYWGTLFSNKPNWHVKFWRWSFAVTLGRLPVLPQVRWTRSLVHHVLRFGNSGTNVQLVLMGSGPQPQDREKWAQRHPECHEMSALSSGKGICAKTKGQVAVILQSHDSRTKGMPLAKLPPRMFCPPSS